jgi:serine/threonine protein kinase
MLALKHEIGDVVKERYTVRAVLGAGAFGTVYRVEETLGQHVVSLACKEMHVLDDGETALNERDDALRMFQEEAFLLQTLRHPNIPTARFEPERGVWLACPVCGLTFRGVKQCPSHGTALQVVRERYYLLMDFLEGADLEQMVEAQGGPLDEGEVLEWMLQVCDALGVVHDKGFSHRDIKPANIKIQRSSPDEPGRAMLIDFGLVKPSAVAGRYGTLVLGKRAAMGTLGYAPPSPEEQASPDARTDILALGMTMYRLLTSRDPTDPQQLEEMRSGRPRDFNPRLSPLIEEIVLKASAPDPEARYSSVGALRADLLAARYPIETECPHCGHTQRSLHAPDASVRCERCGRPVAPPLSGAPASTSSSASSLPTRSAVSSAPPGTRRPSVPAAPSPARRASRGNPLEPRIDAIRRELEQGGAQSGPGASREAQRLAEVERLLGLAQQAGSAPATQCPMCRQPSLARVAAGPAGVCPLCAQAPLERREEPLHACPVCREGSLLEYRLREDELFCPVCAEVPLRVEEKRALLGLISEVRWACDNCGSGWGVDKGQAVLDQLGQDPRGVGPQLSGQSLPAERWRQFSGRGDAWFQCDACASHFEPRGDELALRHVGQDPYGVGARHMNVLLPHGAWAQIGRGGRPLEVTHDCPYCHATWRLERAASSQPSPQDVLTLVQPGRVLTPGARIPSPSTLPHAFWYALSQGKTSPRPGLLCRNAPCASEWDEDKGGLRLVATKDTTLGPVMGQAHSLEDWRRVRSGAPTAEEAGLLQAELPRLRQAASGSGRQGPAAGSRRKELERELADLLKQSALEGHLRIQRVSPGKSADDWRHMTGSFFVLPPGVSHSALAPGEELRWESPANLCAAKVNPPGSPNDYSLSRQAPGLLTLTEQRLMWDGASDDRPRQKLSFSWVDISQVRLVTAGASQVLIVHTRLQVAGFEVPPVRWTLKDSDRLVAVDFTPQDLFALAQSLVL